MSPKQPQEPKVLPWTHKFDTRDMDESVQVSISPDADILEELADYLDVDKCKDVKADFTLACPKGSHTVKVNGTVYATVTQKCVVTLDPIKTKIKEDFDAFYADYSKAIPFSAAKKAAIKKHGMDELPVLEESEDPETMENGKIDLAHLATQFLSLGINPYPHKDGVSLDDAHVQEKEPEEKGYGNPFEALRALQVPKSDDKA